MQYLYDLRIPESESESENESGKVVLKPLDGEVESFEASVHGDALSLVLVLTRYGSSSCRLRKYCDICARASSSLIVLSVRFASPFPFSTAW